MHVVIEISEKVFEFSKAQYPKSKLMPLIGFSETFWLVAECIQKSARKNYTIEDKKIREAICRGFSIEDTEMAWAALAQKLTLEYEAQVTDPDYIETDFYDAVDAFVNGKIFEAKTKGGI